MCKDAGFEAEFGDTYNLRKKILDGFVMTKGSASNERE